METFYSVEVEVSLGNRYVVLATTPDLTSAEAERLSKFLTHRGITSVTRKGEWRAPADVEYL